VGQLAGELAHDFNNLLGVILLYCEILEEQAALPAATRMMISEIHKAGASARNLTRRLLAFSRLQSLQPVMLDLNTTVNQMQLMFDQAPAARQPGSTKAICGGTETILLVDDDAPLRRLTRQLLEDGGYKVVDSGDPAQALRMAGEYPGTLPLMITDLFMPGCSGSVLARKLAPLHPETKVLYYSGYDQDAMTQLGVCGQDHAFLEKPFTRDDLLSKVREILDSPLLPLTGAAFSRVPSPLSRG
jgi:CheY-like chemotaxis protein